jgi:hypothetical protein
MAAEYPPFMNGYGTAGKILAKIKEAQTPDRFTLDFLSTKLGFPGGTAKPFISLAKRIGFLETDGRPTDLYKGFRNPSQSKAAMAAAIKRVIRSCMRETNMFTISTRRNSRNSWWSSRALNRVMQLLGL